MMHFCLFEHVFICSFKNHNETCDNQIITCPNCGKENIQLCEVLYIWFDIIIFYVFFHKAFCTSPEWSLFFSFNSLINASEKVLALSFILSYKNMGFVVLYFTPLQNFQRLFIPSVLGWYKYFMELQSIK